MTMPIRRFDVFCSNTAAWLIAVVVLSSAPLGGIWLAVRWIETPETISLARFIPPACNLVCLNLAVCGLATLCGCLAQRRSVAISWLVAFVFLSVLLNFVEPFLPAFSTAKWLSLLTYFRPVDVVRLGHWPMIHMMVLVGIAVATWIAGAARYWRMDVITA